MSSPTSPRIWQLKDIRYRFLGVECRKCGRRYLGRRMVCPNCGGRDLEIIKLSRHGKIYSYTVVYTPSRGRENYGPYVMAIIELDDGVKVMGEVVDVDPSEVEIGMPVEVVFRKIGEESKAGIIYYGYKFRPII